MLERLRVSRSTELAAYERLVAEGYWNARGTAGLFAEALPPDALQLMQRRHRPDTNGLIPDVSGETLLCFAGLPGGGSDRPELDFWVGRSDASSLPLRIWRRIIDRLLTRATTYRTDDCDPAGLPELRQAISTHLRRARGVSVTHDQIIVTTGGQDALDLAFNVLGSHTKQLRIENPCQLGASLIFTNSALPINPVPVDDKGLRTDLPPRASQIPD